MAKGKALTQVDIRRALDLRSLGHTIREIAEVMEVSPQTLYRILPNDYPEEYEAARKAGDEALADKSRMLTWKYAESGEWKAADKLGNAYVPEFKQLTQKVELTGSDGGPVQIESKEVNLTALLTLAAERGVLADIGHAGLEQALSGAREIRAAPTEPAASDLPSP
jgi:hypothetical protein